MTLDFDNLPDDLAFLKQMVHDLAVALRDQQERTKQLEHQLALLRRHQFGRKSEKIDPAQLLLAFAQLEDDAELPPPPEPSAKPAPKGHGRKPLPEDLPRERIEHDLPPEGKRCGKCGSTLEKIGEDVSRQLDYVPASFVVREHVRLKYACKACEESVVLAPLPPQPIEKGLPGAGLLAHVLVSKYADHLPLHRLEGIFKRQGVEIARSTQCDWVRDSATLLEPIVREMAREVLASKVIHTDDTPVRVQDRLRRGRTRQGRLWVYRGDRDHPYTVFDYTPTRKRDGPATFLEGYKGYLQADAFSGYDGIYAGGHVVEVACWAHARRKFHDAKTTDSSRAHIALAIIRQLYHVERRARELGPKKRREMRQEHSRPVLDHFRAWLDAQALAVLPQSPMGQAIGYTLGQWTALCRYLDDGDLAIDNNAAERELRAIAVGRKNWLFLGSNRGGRRAAIAYSLIATCKRHDIDPFAYLRDVLERVATHPSSGIAVLLPPNWKAAHEALNEGAPTEPAPSTLSPATA
ncbi:IS66 family transposase [Planctomycetota bacterium]